MEKLKIGITGYGKMGKIRENSVIASEDVSLVSIFDIKQVRDRKDVILCSSYEELLNTDIDAVFISSYVNSNADYTIKALKAGKHVFCEKPPAMNQQELLEVERVYKNNSLILKYGFNHRLHHSVMKAKEIINKFYASDFANDQNLVKSFFHKECVLHWNSRNGFMILKYPEIDIFFEGTRQSYDHLRFEFSHILEDGNHVTVRYTLHANTIENPDEEIVLAHFTTIWEVKDGLLYRGYEISQLADDKSVNSDSFQERKI